MAELPNDSGALRLALVLVARDRGSGRILSTAAVEYLDQRDGEWWPMVRLPPLHVDPEAIERLLAGQGELLRGATTGFAWSPAEGSALGIQLGTVSGGAVVEIGFDLGSFLSDVAAVPPRSEAELALFRWTARQADLVRFSDALGAELEALPR